MKENFDRVDGINRQEQSNYENRQLRLGSFQISRGRGKIYSRNALECC